MTKYHNKLTELDGMIFASKKEATRYQELKILERIGKIRELKLQVAYDLNVNDMHICKYVADFTYRDDHDRLVVEDSKGFKNPLYKLKARLMLACLNIRVIET